MPTIEERVKKIIAEQLGVNENEITNEYSDNLDRLFLKNCQIRWASEFPCLMAAPLKSNQSHNPGCGVNPCGDWQQKQYRDKLHKTSAWQNKAGKHRKFSDPNDSISTNPALLTRLRLQVSGQKLLAKCRLSLW